MLNEDRILRRYLDLIKATLRTNFYQPDGNGQNKSYFSFKFNPKAIPELPRPVPKYEIFVYSPRVGACTCAAARWLAAACAGRTARKTSAPRCSAWSRPSR